LAPNARIVAISDRIEKKPKSDDEKIEKWELKAEKAAAAIRSTVSPDLKVHIRDCEDDPVKIGQLEGCIHSTTYWASF